MNINLLLDVAELCLTHVPEGSRVACVDLNVLYEEFQEGKTLCKSKADIREFKNAISTMFPVYKNNRNSNSLMKISLDAVNTACEELSFKLRPIEHMRTVPK